MVRASVLVFNKDFFAQVLQKDARQIVEDRTRAIAAGASGAANGRVRLFTDFSLVQSRQRYRGAVVCINRTESLQEAGQDALVARLKASA